MSTTKRISGDYNLKPTGLVNIDTQLVTINGNLVVTGNSQSIVATDSVITDSTITLNHGLGSTNPNPNGAQLIVDRGNQANVSIRWNESTQTWQFTTDGTTFSNFAVGSAGSTGPALSRVFEDKNPNLGGNLNITGTTLYDTANNVTVSTGVVGAGGTGVYATNAANQSVELIEVNRSIAYGIIFG
jgi:hypothetical protein